MAKILISLVLTVVALVFAPAASAQAPTPDIPYSFEPIELEEGPPPVALAELTTDTSFINSLGSYVVTIWVMLDNFAGGVGVLAYLVIFLMGVAAIRWIARYVYNRPTHETISIHTLPDLDDLAYLDKKFSGNAFIRPPKDEKRGGIRRPRF